ncbi:unnamed protein product [Cylicocyclus nassatus]|uniref:DUF1758 domain-containing protein n=1 Tax=Cylicocyclus nassatus TaxID=53992 RepID=A0AA36MAE7_CYLNA|nr:unnamed protein product [Cylicocyclus nassatus]
MLKNILPVTFEIALHIKTRIKYRIEPSQPVLNPLSNDVLESLRFELASTKTNLLKTHNKIVKLHEEWISLQSDPTEQRVFEDYVTKHGDYRTDIASATNILEQCDAILNALDAEYVKRELNPPLDLSDVTPLDDEGKTNTRRPLYILRQTRLFSTSRCFHSNKLDLPTFDGNLLDFPEFNAWFATLVANKSQLNDTTKFSLLKSCLRGRALQSIQGLSMTAENYHIAIGILKTLYDDKNHTVHLEEPNKKPVTSFIDQNEQPVDSQIDVPTTQAPVTCSTNNVTNITTQTALMCTTVTLFNPKDRSHQTTVTAFLDSGSNKSYITDEVATILHLPTIGSEHISLSTFGKIESPELECRNHVIGLYTEKGVKHLQVKSIPLLTGNLQRIQIPEGSTSNVTLSVCQPSILVGNDYFWDIILSEDFHHRTLSKSYRILHVAIGDMIVGRSFKAKNYVTCTAVNSITETDDASNPSNHKELIELVSNFWRLETIGILDDPLQQDDEQCLKYFNNSVYYDEVQRRTSEYQRLSTSRTGTSARPHWDSSSEQAMQDLDFKRHRKSLPNGRLA